MAKLLSPSPDKPKTNWGNVIGSLLRSIGIDTDPQYSSGWQNGQYVSQKVTPQPTPTPIPTAIPTPTPVPRRTYTAGAGSVKDPEFNKLMEIMAQKAIEKGFNPSVPVGQMAAESQRGQSRRAREQNNYFGLGVYNDSAEGLKFNSPEESMDYYLNLIAKDPRYSEAYNSRTNPESYLDALSRVPYATDPNYKVMIMNTPEYRRYTSS